MVSRIYVEKKPGFDVEAKQLLAELHIAVPEGLSPDANLRLINQYDVEGIDEALFDQTVPTVFSEPQVDNATRTLPVSGAQLATETAQELARQGKPTTGIVALPETSAFSPSRPFPANSTSAPTPPPSAFSSSAKASVPSSLSPRSMSSKAPAPIRLWTKSSTTSSTPSKRVRQASHRARR